MKKRAEIKALKKQVENIWSQLDGFRITDGQLQSLIVQVANEAGLQVFSGPVVKKKEVPF